MITNPMRSVLYVPGDKMRAIEKSCSLKIDAVILDLEDSVAPEHKELARENIRQALKASWHCQVLVRINGPGTPWEDADREMALLGGINGIVLPKVEQAHKLKDLHLRVPLWPMIETPKGVLNAPDIAAISGVAGLIVGTNDLAYILHSRPHPERLPLLYALSAVVFASRAYGRIPLDAVFNNIHSTEGFIHECKQGRDLGFAGKTLIHPSQVEPANTYFGVTTTEAQEAQDLLKVWQEARAQGKSITLWQGALIEQMHVYKAQETLKLWELEQS